MEDEKEKIIDGTTDSEEELFCHFCSGKFLTFEALNEHMQCHVKSEDTVNVAVSVLHIKPEELDLKQDCDSQLVDREQRCEVFPVHECPVCRHVFTQACNLKTHLRLHNNERPFECPECQRCFSSKLNMQTHIRTHYGEKPFVCSFCDKRFTQASSLKIHIRSHTGERPYTCFDCSRTFTKSSDLRRHKPVHLAVKPFNCTHCIKSFTSRSALSAHRRYHTNERPFVCFVCDKRFTRKSCLQMHVRRHALKGDHSERGDGRENKDVSLNGASAM